EYVEHYHLERNHQGLGNQLIVPAPMNRWTPVKRRERLGGMLSFYHRDAAGHRSDRFLAHYQLGPSQTLSSETDVGRPGTEMDRGQAVAGIGAQAAGRQERRLSHVPLLCRDLAPLDGTRRNWVEREGTISSVSFREVMCEGRDPACLF